MKGRETLAEKKVVRPVTKSPRILSQIELLRMVKSGDESAAKEIIKRLNNGENNQRRSRE